MARVGNCCVHCTHADLACAMSMAKWDTQHLICHKGYTNTLGYKDKRTERVYNIYHPTLRNMNHRNVIQLLLEMGVSRDGTLAVGACSLLCEMH